MHQTSRCTGTNMDQSPPDFSNAFFEEFEELLKWRRDVRAFETTPVDNAVVETLLARAVSCAPSVGNAQPWRIVRVTSKETRQTVKNHVEAEQTRAASIYDNETAKHYRQLKLHGLDKAPEQLAFFSKMDPAEGRGLGRQTMPETLVWSTVMAIHTLWLLARAKGLGLGWVSLLEPEQMNKLLDCPDDWRFVAYLCLGKPASESQTPDLVKRGWQQHLPLNKLVFTR